MYIFFRFCFLFSLRIVWGEVAIIHIHVNARFWDVYRINYGFFSPIRIQSLERFMARSSKCNQALRQLYSDFIWLNFLIWLDRCLSEFAHDVNLKLGHKRYSDGQ